MDGANGQHTSSQQAGVPPFRRLTTAQVAARVGGTWQTVWKVYVHKRLLTPLHADDGGTYFDEAEVNVLLSRLAEGGHQLPEPVNPEGAFATPEEVWSLMQDLAGLRRELAEFRAAVEKYLSPLEGIRDEMREVRRLMAEERVPRDPAHQLLTVDEACERLAMGRTNIYRLIRAGYLIPKKVGGRLRFSERELERFVDLKIAVPPNAKPKPTK